MFDLSALLVFFLVVLAAALAGYGLVVWNRDRDRPLARTGMAAGTLFLLAAAVIVVLLILLSPLQFPGRVWLSRPVLEPAPPGHPSSETAVEAASLAASEPQSKAASFEPVDGDRADPVGPQTSARASPQPPHAGTGRAGVTSSSPLARPEDLWGATQCVLAFHLDPSDRRRWTIENECGWPVGILLATCSQSPAECNERASSSWRYPTDGIILPAKAQRPVTDAQQTAHGRQIRYVACFVTTPEAIRLIGQPRVSTESSSSPQRDSLAAARTMDECLTRVQSASSAGNRSGASIEVLLGASLPENALPTD